MNGMYCFTRGMSAPTTPSECSRRNETSPSWFHDWWRNSTWRGNPANTSAILTMWWRFAPVFVNEYGNWTRSEPSRLCRASSWSVWRTDRVSSGRRDFPCVNVEWSLTWNWKPGASWTAPIHSRASAAERESSQNVARTSAVWKCRAKKFSFSADEAPSEG